MLHYPIFTLQWYKRTKSFILLLPNSGRRSIERSPDKSMPDDHSKLVPPLPIPNRTVKQLCADDSAATSVKVGYCQACYSKKPLPVTRLGFFYVWRFILRSVQAKKAALCAAFLLPRLFAQKTYCALRPSNQLRPGAAS